MSPNQIQTNSTKFIYIFFGRLKTKVLVNEKTISCFV